MKNKKSARNKTVVQGAKEICKVLKKSKCRLLKPISKTQAYGEVD
jgi:hypothetical protein